MQSSTVIFTLFFLNITYSFFRVEVLFPFFECRSPSFNLRWLDSFAVKAVRIQVLVQTIFRGCHIFSAVLCAKQKFFNRLGSNPGRLLAIGSEDQSLNHSAKVARITVLKGSQEFLESFRLTDTNLPGQSNRIFSGEFCISVNLIPLRESLLVSLC